MKVFDMHSDIGTHLYEKHLAGEKDVFRKYHIDKLKCGEVKGVFTACFFSGEQNWEYMQKMILNCNEEINSNDKTCTLVKNRKDLIEDNKLLTCISVEGMCGVDSDVESKIEWMYQNNVRIASLCWNESNHLAEGWPNNSLRGLSEDGFKVIKKMNELNMIIDVSHINEAGFWDIIKTSTKPVLVTHSNARRLCSHERNLTNQQLKAIASKGGLIGLNTCKFFISNDESKQNSKELARHARYMADLVGVDHIACGFDYMDFLSDESAKDNCDDLRSAADTQNLITELKEVGFNDDEISKIAYYNVYYFLMNQL